jgi:hypothetical protein
MLVAARNSVLSDALSEALGQVDPHVVKKQILAYVPSDVQRILAARPASAMNTFFLYQQSWRRKLL